MVGGRVCVGVALLVGVTDGVGEGVIVSVGVLVGMKVADRLAFSAGRASSGGDGVSGTGEGWGEHPTKSSRKSPAKKQSAILFIISQKNNTKTNLVCPTTVLLQIR